MRSIGGSEPLDFAVAFRARSRLPRGPAHRENIRPIHSPILRGRELFGQTITNFKSQLAERLAASQVQADSEDVGPERVLDGDTDYLAGVHLSFLRFMISSAL